MEGAFMLLQTTGYYCQPELSRVCVLTLPSIDIDGQD